MLIARDMSNSICNKRKHSKELFKTFSKSKTEWKSKDYKMAQAYNESK